MNPEPVSAAPDNLGPSVTTEFPDVIGLSGLRARGPGSSGRETMAPAAAAQPSDPVPQLPQKLLEQTLLQVDALLSSGLEVDAEDEKVIISLTEAVYPLANYYAKGASSVAAMWTVAVIGLTGYGFMKYKKVTAKGDTK